MPAENFAQLEGLTELQDIVIKDKAPIDEQQSSYCISNLTALSRRKKIQPPRPLGSHVRALQNRNNLYFFTYL
tara:strand:- start:8235 stop:8453 length:219 start_codon:yes stop_codon:yes gene_type:complete